MCACRVVTNVHPYGEGVAVERYTEQCQACQDEQDEEANWESIMENEPQ